MQDSIRMRVTQVLERSKLDTMPVSVSFKTKTIWYAFLYWLFQSFIIACVYSGSSWFLPLFNLVTIGWAWDKITSQHNSLVESVINVENVNDRDLELGETSEISERPKVKIVKEQRVNNSSLFSSVEDSIQASEIDTPLFSPKLFDDGTNLFGSDLVPTGSIVGPEANPIVDMNNTADRIGNSL